MTQLRKNYSKAQDSATLSQHRSHSTLTSGFASPGIYNVSLWLYSCTEIVQHSHFTLRLCLAWQQTCQKSLEYTPQEQE